MITTTRDEWLVSTHMPQPIPEGASIDEDCSEISCKNNAGFFDLFMIGGLQIIVYYCGDHVKPVEELFKK